jgi:hypothetical protein
MGVTRELGRAESFPVGQGSGVTLRNTPGSGEQPRSPVEFIGDIEDTNQEGRYRVSWKDSEERTTTRRTFGSLSGS